MKKLHILWTNADVETSRYMVLLYAKNSMLRSWWDEVTVIVWGAPARLIAENEEIAAELRVAQDAGVKVSVVALWNVQMLPVGADSGHQSDGWYDTSYQSFGATCADYFCPLQAASEDSHALRARNDAQFYHRRGRVSRPAKD